MTYPSTVESCFCAACIGEVAAHQCSACGQEVRYGQRDGETMYLHREPVDHHTILGHRYTAADAAEAERQRHLVRHQDDGTEYTTAEYEIKKDPDATRRKRRLAELRGEDPDAPPPPIPAPEIPRHDLTVDELRPRSGIRTMAQFVLGKNKDKLKGWELYRLTHSRGPYLGADGSVLSISDRIVLGARGPVALDGSRPIVVASWRDYEFDTGYAGVLKDGVVKADPMSSTDLKTFMKERSA